MKNSNLEAFLSSLLGHRERRLILCFAFDNVSSIKCTKT